MTYKNIEDKKKYDKEWFKNNPEKRREYERRWRENNPDKVKAQKKRYSERKGEYIRQKSRNYYYSIAKIKITENPEEYRKKWKEANIRKMEKKRLLLNNIRVEMGGKCSVCGYNTEIRILQFHHLGNKVDNVTNLQSEKKIREESAKCVLLCPNCHAIKHLNG